MDPKLVAAGYDRVADRYASLESPEAEWPRLRRLRELLAEVPPGGSVLDVGCGAGEALAVISEQHRATGIDVSAAQLERASRAAPTARIVHGDVREVELAGPFDAVVAFYVVDHVPRTEHAELFRTFHDRLAPGGRLLFTIETEEAEDVVSEWLGTPMFFSQFAPERTLELVRAAGFDVESIETETQLEGGKAIEYVWVRARRGQ